jgi:diguanylate cyclase (GGDEF)-like protein
MRMAGAALGPWRKRARPGADGSAAEGELFGSDQRVSMLVALLVVGLVLGALALGASVVGAHDVGVLAETVFLAGKLGCIAWALRARELSVSASSAIVAFNTVCATASNLLYPGSFRPFTAQLLLSVLFVCWFFPRGLMVAQLALLAAAAAVTLLGADPLGAEALRIGTIAVTGAAIAVVCRALRNRQEQLTAQATLDPLTGIGNRRAYDQQVLAAFAHAQRQAEPLSLVLIDLDGFKELNDSQGHPAGDSELRAVARLLTHRARRQDSVFRLGGDEFAILLPGTPAGGAAQLSSELTGHAGRRRIGLRTTLTAGVAAFPDHADSAQGLERAADRALLEGKRAGKQQVALAHEIRPVARPVSAGSIGGPDPLATRHVRHGPGRSAQAHESAEAPAGQRAPISGGGE